MIKWDITYKDFNGNEQTKEVYFHLSRAEVIEKQLNEVNGQYEDFEDKVKKIVGGLQGKPLLALWKDIVSSAFGVKSGDGQRFEKSEEAWRAFEQSNAYDELFIELLQNPDKAAKFINGIMPANMPKEGEFVGTPIDSSAAARAASEARMQGYKQPAQKDPEVVHAEVAPPASQPIQVGPDETQASPPVQAPNPDVPEQQYSDEELREARRKLGLQ